MKFYVLTQRNDYASPQHAGIFNFEDILVKTCDANLTFVKSKRITKRFDSINFLGHYKHFLRRNLIEKTIGLHEPILNLPATKSSEVQVLLLVGLSPSSIALLNSIPEWRKRFDIVAAFIYDGWIFDGYHQITSMVDHLFVTVPALVNPLKNRFGIEVSFLPFSTDVVGSGSKNLNRSIDVASYGRVPLEYHTSLFNLLNHSQKDSFYYRQVPEYSQHYPSQMFDSQRFDYQHLKILGKVLAHSKISLAFDFTYTTKNPVELRESQNHPSYRYPKPVLTPRWFEGLAAGCAVVGRRPPAPEVDELIGWEDATIDVPDDLDSGIDLIMSLLKDQDRLHAIHQRNYQEMLKQHDHRWRIKTILDRLNLPIPQELNDQLEQCISLAAGEKLSRVM